ncbi:MAG: PDZ domain-containing protein [Dethiobacteria bacterium]|nr:PDZ domain-containing protein [Bacillota bacterium]
MRKFLAILLSILIIIGCNFYIQNNFYLLKPGSLENLAQMVNIGEKSGAKNEEGFYLVTAAQQRANLPLLIYALFNPTIDIRKKASFIPSGMTIEEYKELMRQWMKESQLMAKVIALRRLGYDVEIVSKGIEVVGFLEKSPAKGILQKGDIIKAVNGTPVSLVDEVIAKVQELPIGETVSLTVERGLETFELVMPTTSDSEEPDKAALRVYICSLNREAKLPLEIEIDTGQIGGPSAGLMFVLEIVNQLTAGDLTGGYKIAGTGTININEKIGTIGGVKQKIAAAEMAGVDYFFVPKGNYELAKASAKEVNVIPVTELEEVLIFLDSLAAGAELFDKDKDLCYTINPNTKIAYIN